MDKVLVAAARGLHGTLTVPGDKSISHRSIMFGALAKGTTIIDHFLFSDDCRRTLAAFQALGVPITVDGERVTITGVGFAGLKAPQQALDLGNSGTSTRLLLGLFSKQPFPIKFFGDASLSKRPMKRVIAPLSKMGAKIQATDTDFLPLTIATNTTLQPVEMTIPVASAQVKSALIFAALQANGTSKLTELAQTRDHTERMLRQFGGEIDKNGLTLTIKPQSQFVAQKFRVPGDMSSAAFFALAATLVPNSQLRLAQVGLNNTRTGFLDVLSRMGADFRVEDVDSKTVEASGDVIVTSSKLKATTVHGAEIANVIDEIPLIALAATQAEGVTEISDAAELRVKETDRIETVATELRKLGANIETKPDGMIIHGPTPLRAVTSDRVDSHGDHRIGLMLAVAALLSKSQLTLTDAAAINVSYPNFFTDLEQVLD
ncbi:3-phosphoshikimate 1-carboxyvinyltransferase [Loigolactobacillus zhaoyuanensis]|uniref:3-phosphoshikimate 1-carboxyvinyltransferase n=1 Tax=Loigolactobacillus zhaoyuanensis TaxID=2486017 RepID=UPI000F73A46B|nr:3-phosphoshikimate 1-carboxyvinyltransferase [Loigolactobacillus zhaoyuanensis]